MVCAVARDITERKRAEMALREVKEAERSRMAGICTMVPCKVRRHAKASKVWVSLKIDSSDLVAEVIDDGRGFGPDAVPGIGSRSMRERIAALGGELEVESEPREGTQVRLRVPTNVLLGKVSEIKAPPDRTADDERVR